MPGEFDSAFRNNINERGGDTAVFIVADIGESHIVGKDKYDIWLTARLALLHVHNTRSIKVDRIPNNKINNEAIKKKRKTNRYIETHGET